MTAVADPRDCPYVGLDPFEKAYEPFFFGREQDSRVIADHVAARSITVLYGPSGVGKSSVLNVGLPSALRRRQPWIITVLRDWQDPSTIGEQGVRAFEAALSASGKIGREPAVSTPQLIDAMLAVEQPLLLILDQFEEYFLYRTENLFTPVEKALGALLARRDLDLHLLISLRDDSLHLLDKLRAILPGILETTIPLSHLSDPDVKRAIRGPIERYNELYREGLAPIEVEDDLVEMLTRDLRRGRDQLVSHGIGPNPPQLIELPYLQLTMTKLWVQEGGREATGLRAETLATKLGGVEQIARKHVDGILSGLTGKEQSLSAEIFRYLVTAGGGKIAYPTRDLAEQINDDRRQYGDNDEIVSEDEVKAVLDKLARTERRLTKPVTVNGLASFELFHDVLGQPVLRWRREFLENARLHAEQLRADQRSREEQRLADERKAFDAFFEAIEPPPDPPDSAKPTTDPSALRLVAQAPALAAKLADMEAAAAVHVVLTRIEQATNPERVLTLMQALHALRVEPTEAQAQRAINSILTAIKRTTSPFAFQPLVTALQVLPVNLTDAQAQTAIDSILTAIKRNAVPFVVMSLVQALVSITDKLTGESAQRAIGSILAVATETSDPDTLQSLTTALPSLAVKLTDDQARITIDSILVVLKRTSQPIVLQQLARALSAFNPRLTDANTQAAVEIVLSTFVRTSDSNQLRSLAEALRVLPNRLTSAQSQVAIESVLAAMRYNNNNIVLQSQAETLKALAAKLTDAQAQVAIASILAAIKQTNNQTLTALFAQALRPLAAKLSDAEAPMKTIVSAITQIKNSISLQPLAQALTAFTPKLTKTQTQAAVESILTAIKQTADPHALRSLADALCLVPAKLTGEQAQAAAECLLSATKKTTDPEELLALAEGLQALPIKLTSEQAQPAIDSILAAVKRTGPDREAFQSVAQAWQALEPKLTNGYAHEILQPYFAERPR